MIVVDASCLYEVLTRGPLATQVQQALAQEEDYAAPELIDVEVTGLIRRDAHLGVLDATRCDIALSSLTDWPADRYSHQPFIWRVWELRDNVRTSDAFYVALAEALDVPLLTLDARLSRATGPRCEVIVPGTPSHV